MIRFVFVLSLLAGNAVAQTAKPGNQGTPAPDTLTPAKTYQMCLSMARAYPEQGVEFSGKWIGLGGGEPAKHCQAVSMMGMHEYGEAATRLEELAQNSKQPNPVRAGMLAQAAQSWLLHGDNERAYAAQTAALKLTPKDVKLLIDRSLTLAEAKNYWESIDDLNTAVSLDPTNADAYAFRASAYRMVSADDLAMDDAERALSIDPQNVSALLERGILSRMKNNDNGARKDWMKILELAPDSDAARAARANIERMDVRTE